MHAGLRTRLSGPTSHSDHLDDNQAGFLRIHADDIDIDIDTLPGGGGGGGGGPTQIISTILSRIGTTRPVYLSVDIDVLDPGLAPGTGTPEPGGWTTRELIRILRGVEGLNVVGADVVEVAPMYDNGGGEVTALAAAQVVFEVLSSIVKRGWGRWELICMVWRKGELVEEGEMEQVEYKQVGRQEMSCEYYVVLVGMIVF